MSVCLPFVGFWPPSLPPACALLWEAQPAAKRALGAPLRLMPASACGARLCTAGGRQREAPKVTQSEVGSRALSPPVMPFRLGPEQGTTTELVGGRGRKKRRSIPNVYEISPVSGHQILVSYSVTRFCSFILGYRANLPSRTERSRKDTHTDPSRLYQSLQLPQSWWHLR